MKWYYCFLVITLLPACKAKEQQQPVKTDTTRIEMEDHSSKPISYNDTVGMPYRTEDDSGYFKGQIPEKITEFETQHVTPQFHILSGIVNKKELVLISDETLSHSVLIDQKIRTRYDTLKNKKCSITSVYKFGNLSSQKIKINGIVIKVTAGPDWEHLNEVIFDFDATSFRNFSFQGKEFYYIQARFIDMFGSSSGNVYYHLIYSKEKKRLSCFETCRSAPMLFGDVNGNNQLDYLEFDNSPFCPTIPYSDEVEVYLYSCNEKGEFVLQKDNKGKEYFISARTGHDRSNDSFNIKGHYWPWLSR